MDDRLLALSRAREALREVGVRTAEQFHGMDPPTYAKVATHFGLVSRILATGHPDVLAALWTDVIWRVVSLPAPDPHSLLYVGDALLTIAVYDDEPGQRRAWRQLMAWVAPGDTYARRGFRGRTTNVTGLRHVAPTPSS